MRPLPNPAHPKCQQHGCRSYAHLVCPVECELVCPPDPEQEGIVPAIPLSVLKQAPTIAIT